ncbi:MAG TPA: phosphate regulon sensor histidine kinase PhoR [Burkholderiaceae bacterium]|nr:phosphate regulon sensor histidine kinase PhoR [Burkholderiaceae bacterium]
MSERFARIRIVYPALVRLALLGLVALVVDYFFGDRAALWFTLVSFAAVLGFHFFYLSVLGAWLEHPSLDTVPEAAGAWSEVFARLYKSRRASELNESRLAENEQRFRRTISALPEGIVLVDAQLQIEWCNPVAERHLGISLRADQGLRLTNLVRDPSFVAYLTSARFDNPLTFRPLANAGIALSVQVIEFESARSIVLTRDVTQSERVDAMRRDFVANVSHELRTPLTVVKGFLETLLDAQPPLDPTRRHHLQLMHEQANRMSHLVEDLLLLSRLESQETALQEEDVDVGQLVRELGDEARALSAGRHTIAVEAAAIGLRGSREELRSAFSNLVTNAIRYTPSGGRIWLRWRADEDGAVFEVEDTGIGVAPEHIPRLTERFYRVDKSRSRETGGTGLGLAIVKHVLHRHDGRLDVTSQLGRGSVFVAHLPRSRLIAAREEGRLRAA